MKKGFSVFGILVFAVIVIAGYEFALDKFHGKSFEVFNYKIRITSCGPRVNDRIDTIEEKVKKQ